MGKTATIELTCLMLPEDDPVAEERTEETREMYERARPLVEAAGGVLRLSEHYDYREQTMYGDAYVDVPLANLEALLDLFDEDEIGYDNVDLNNKPNKATLARLKRRFPRGRGIWLNEQWPRRRKGP